MFYPRPNCVYMCNILQSIQLYMRRIPTTYHVILLTLSYVSYPSTMYLAAVRNILYMYARSRSRGRVSRHCHVTCH